MPRRLYTEPASVRERVAAAFAERVKDKHLTRRECATFAAMAESWRRTIKPKAPTMTPLGVVSSE